MYFLDFFIDGFHGFLSWFLVYLNFSLGFRQVLSSLFSLGFIRGFLWVFSTFFFRFIQGFLKVISMVLSRFLHGSLHRVSSMVLTWFSLKVLSKVHSWLYPCFSLGFIQGSLSIFSKVPPGFMQIFSSFYPRFSLGFSTVLYRFSSTCDFLTRFYPSFLSVFCKVIYKFYTRFILGYIHAFL